MTADGAVQRKTAEQLHDEDIERRTLEAAAQRIEGMAGNTLYMMAWKRAAKFLRAMKP